MKLVHFDIFNSYFIPVKLNLDYAFKFEHLEDEFRLINWKVV